VEIEHAPHQEPCYQVRLEALKRQYGEKASWSESDYWHVPYGSIHEKAYKRAKRKLCKEIGCDYEFGNEMHCTCGVNAAWKARYDACRCDWHLGKGLFRFGAAADAPNFWHKPSGLKVRWYKYIGRDMEIEGADGVEFRAVVDSCLASLGTDLDKAADEYAQAEEKAREDARKAMEFWLSAEGQAVTKDLMDSGALKVVTFCGKPTDV